MHANLLTCWFEVMKKVARGYARLRWTGVLPIVAMAEAIGKTLAAMLRRWARLCLLPLHRGMVDRAVENNVIFGCHYHDEETRSALC